MKSINEYINESVSDSKSDIEKIFDEIKDLDTNFKIIDKTLIWRASIVRDADFEVAQIGSFWHPDTGKAPKGEVSIGSWLEIYVITTDKGNFYGLNKNIVKGNAKLSSVFKNKVKGATEFAWSKNFDAVKDIFINYEFPKSLNKYNPNNIMQIATNYDLIKQFADNLKNSLKGDCHVKYYKSKIDQVKQNIEICKKHIKEYTDKLKDLEDDLVELQTLQNVGPEKFNESIEIQEN